MTGTRVKYRLMISTQRIHSKAADSLKDHLAAYPSTIMRRTHMSLTNDTSTSTNSTHQNNADDDTDEKQTQNGMT